MDPGAEMSPLPGDLCMTREKRAYKLGCCHLALGDAAAAEEWFQSGLEAGPAHGGCHYGLARTAYCAATAPAPGSGWRRP